MAGTRLYPRPGPSSAEDTPLGISRCCDGVGEESGPCNGWQGLDFKRY